MIRKEGKARWVYTCDLCNVRLTRPDQFRAIEAMQRHQRSQEHGFKVIGAALEPFVEAMSNIATAAASMAETVHAVFAPPPNLPHDPTLLRDRRKWGGR
ncbi:hypothetical protein SAMN04487917_101368 [Arthrobacter sp. yr096]|uniref:hypothetical protein n=1 Tax=Arthrobacter sp. yr096 TaxID=1761750 RepID=UPI0008BE3700|nr:hypothetical protein [Arthrobacter sp. yr096]SEI45228.1 hypothetical protein SAMN04487917_101368 [Arthrobacter sp. yr096]